MAHGILHPVDAAAQLNRSFKLRSYQTEMLDRSLKGNIIVAMDTGSGKTHIAIARIRAELETTNHDKLIWFLAPSRTLAEQQYTALSRELSAHGVRLLTGADGVEKWTDQRLWDAVLTNIKVVVATPAVLKDALSHGFVTISRLALCVFDEAHRCTKKAPMNQIMQLFYRPAKERGESVPRILGLSASPVTSVKQGGLETIESNLDSLAVTPKVHRSELEKHVNQPQLQTMRFSTDPRTRSDPLCNALATATKSYDISRDPFVVVLRSQDDERSKRSLMKVLLRKDTYCLQQLRALDLRAAGLQEQLGLSMAHWYVSTCIEKFRRGCSDTGTSLMPDLNEDEKKHLSSIFNAIEHQDHGPAELNIVDSTDYLISEKARLLFELLVQHADPSVRCLIFVEQRVQVTALAELLRRTPALKEIYKVAAFVGSSANTNRKISVADLVALSEQEQDLQAFREGRKNLMVATNVLEEGIDISACNLVICFDAPKNLVSFVQRRGRARRADSKYFLFASDEEFERGNKPWSALEAEMKALYMDDARTLQLKPSEDRPRTYGVPSTGALLTMDDAMSHLYHFCSVSSRQANNYTDLRPEFESKLDPVTKSWTAEVDLPISVHPSVRHACAVQEWASEEAAMQDAALEAYKALHRNGLVNDNLLPLVKDYGPEIGVEHLDQPSIVEVAVLKSPLSETWSGSNEVRTWTSTRVQLLLGEALIVEMLMWLPTTIPAIQSFDLYWNSHITYHVRSLAKGPHDYSQSVPECTATLLSAAHALRMEDGRQDFAVLFSSPGLDDASRAISRDGRTQSATSFFASNSSLDSAGLAHTAGQQGRSFFIDNINQDSSEVICHAFPKRKDFLHPITEGSALGSAHSSRESIPIDQCTIDTLPAKYALFSAFIPSILHKLETSLLAQDLMSNSLKNIGLTDITVIQEAISSPAASEAHDYNRLEYLGDCILKHYTELQVMSQHTHWPEAYLTLERDRIVRNTNLAKAALEIGLDKYILTKPFTGSKWRPPYISDLVKGQSTTRQMSTKTLADVVEALIGAAYVEGGTEQAFHCIEVLLPRETWHSAGDCLRTLVTELTPTSVSNLTMLEKLVGHDFVHPTLLVEAITHVSFPYNKTGMSYERLEFLGDSVLDMIITPKLFAHAKRLKHWQLHSVHAALVNSHYLGYCCLRYTLTDHFFNVVQSSSGDLTSATAERTVHLYDFLRAGSQLTEAKHRAIEAFNKLSPEIETEMANGGIYPWVEFVTLSPPKFFCDLVESILGAIYIDTQGDMAACEAFIARLGVLGYMQRLLDKDIDCVSPKERLGILADQDKVKYLTDPVEDGEGVRRWRGVVEVGQDRIVTVEQCASREEAEVRAAFEACGVLKSREEPNRLGRKRRKLFAAGLEEVEQMQDEV